MVKAANIRVDRANAALFRFTPNNKYYVFFPERREVSPEGPKRLPDILKKDNSAKDQLAFQIVPIRTR
jgi:hypothetical protein